MMQTGTIPTASSRWLKRVRCFPGFDAAPDCATARSQNFCCTRKKPFAELAGVVKVKLFVAGLLVAASVQFFESAEFCTILLLPETSPVTLNWRFPVPRTVGVSRRIVGRNKSARLLTRLAPSTHR